VYNIASRSSFDQALRYHEYVERLVQSDDPERSGPADDEMAEMLVGDQSMISKREVSHVEGRYAAIARGFSHIEVDSVSGSHLEHAFAQLIRQMRTTRRKQARRWYEQYTLPKPRPLEIGMRPGLERKGYLPLPNFL
jgi:hypothetical protein